MMPTARSPGRTATIGAGGVAAPHRREVEGKDPNAFTRSLAAAERRGAMKGGPDGGGPKGDATAFATGAVPGARAGRDPDVANGEGTGRESSGAHADRTDPIPSDGERTGAVAASGIPGPSLDPSPHRSACPAGTLAPASTAGRSDTRPANGRLDPRAGGDAIAMPSPGAPAIRAAGEGEARRTAPPLASSLASSIDPSREGPPAARRPPDPTVPIRAVTAPGSNARAVPLEVSSPDVVLQPGATLRDLIARHALAGAIVPSPGAPAGSVEGSACPSLQATLGPPAGPLAPAAAIRAVAALVPAPPAEPITLHLRPADLGSLEVELVRRGGVLMVEIRVETPEALRAIEGERATLEAALRERDGVRDGAGEGGRGASVALSMHTPGDARGRERPDDDGERARAPTKEGPTAPVPALRTI